MMEIFEINQRLSNGFLYNSVYFLVKVFIRRVVKKISAVVFISGMQKIILLKNTVILIPCCPQ